MTTAFSRIVSQAAVATLVAVFAVSTGARADKPVQATGPSANVTVADLDPLCGHHYPTA